MKTFEKECVKVKTQSHRHYWIKKGLHKVELRGA
jgi:hypothetical protein